MKKISLLLVWITLIVTSCSSVRVASDYDRKVDFSKYKNFAFFKDGVDQIKISDLDKKRILSAITDNLKSKGLNLSSNPQLLVNIFTKENERIDIYDNYNFGWGWWPFWGGVPYSVTKHKEGILYIDLIDNEKKELIWQGQVNGYLPSSYSSVEKKEERIKEFVDQILNQFPPK